MSELKSPDIEAGDRVVDSNPKGAPSALRAIDFPETRADEFHIAAIGKTVAAVNDCPADDPVIGVVFERDQNDGNATIYHYPASRLEPISEDWEPPADSSRSSGRQEREEIFGEHDDAVDSFIADLRRSLSEPEAVAKEILDMLAVDEETPVTNAEVVLMDMASPGANAIRPRSGDDAPQTRGECRHSRDDTYQPEDDDAMCCWECSNRSHNRPEKFKRGDSAGSACSRSGQSPWKLREAVVKATDLSELPDGFAQTYDGDSRRLLHDIAALQSGDEDRIRKAALRMAYRPHLGDVEEYNYSRAAALLRDRGVAAELPIIGDSGGDSQ